MLHKPHKTCERNSLTQDCLICWRLVRSPGAAVGCRARFRPVSPSAQMEARGCTLKLQPAFWLMGQASRSPALQGQGAATRWEGCFSAHMHGVHCSTSVPLCTLGLKNGTAPLQGPWGPGLPGWLQQQVTLPGLLRSQGFPAHGYHSAWLHKLNP